MTNVYHLIDPERGRADVRKTWTLCGRAVRSCFVFRSGASIATCPKCIELTHQKQHGTDHDFPVTGTDNSESPDSEKGKGGAK
jgi:hypothetical protein